MSIVAPGDNRVPQFNPWTSISFQERAAPLAVLGLVGLSFAPLLVEHLWNLSSFEHHKHFPLVIGGVLFLIWKRWPRSYAGLASLTIDEHDLVEVQSAVPWPRWVSLLWTVVLWSCLGGLLIAILLHSPWSATVFAIGVLTACVFVFAGSQVVLPY